MIEFSESDYSSAAKIAAKRIESQRFDAQRDVLKI